MPRGKAGKLQQRSPAEFFAENKNIAGFDRNLILVRSSASLSAHVM